MRRFWSERKGNVAVLFALAIVPIIGAVGAAVDYSLAASYRTDMQKALDSTALALSKVIPMEEAKLNALAKQHFEASMGNHDLTDLKLTVTPEKGKVKVYVSGYYKPRVVNLLGITAFEIGTGSEAIWSMGKVEIALVLDMSLSMNSPAERINALRASTLSLIDVIESAVREPGDAKIGIVPFDGMVNVGYTYSNRPNWVRFDWWDENVYDSIGNRCKINNSSESFNISSVPNGTSPAAYCRSRYKDISSCQGGSGSTKSACEKTKGAKWVTTRHYGVWTPLNNHKDWKGCVYDRRPDLNHDVSDTAPNTTTSTNATALQTKYPAAPCYSSTPPQAITPLTDNWATLRSRAKALTPTGYTNISIGLAWGWHVLSPTALHTEGAAYDADELTKYIILMTDGYNTKNISMEPGNCNTNGPTCPTVDNRMSLVCDNIKAVKKADGTSAIKIYTIRLIDGNANLLRNCASSNDMYYDVQSASQLANVFNSIGAEIASLHLAK